MWGELVKSFKNLGRRYLEGSEDQEKWKEEEEQRGSRIEVWKMLISHRTAKCDLIDTHSVTKCHCKCVFQVPPNSLTNCLN